VAEDTAEVAVYVVAAAHQADAARLTDSASFMQTVQGLGPDTPGFMDRLSSAVGQAVEREPGRFRLGGAQATAAPPGPPSAGNGDGRQAQAPQQPMSRTERLIARNQRRAALAAPDYGGPDGSAITREDCADADPQTVNAWMNAGKLAHLGYPAPRRRR
jgi:hypothetical protein